jgi:HEAT repeat protein
MKRHLISIIILLLSCGLSPKDKGLKILHEGIKSESVVIRAYAAKGLKQIGDAQGYETIKEMLNSTQKDDIVAALDVLYQLDENSFSPIVMKLTENNDPLIKTNALRSIAANDDERYKEVLMKGTKADLVKVRKISYLGLEKFKEKDVIFNGLRDNDAIVRIAAAKALGRMGEEGMDDFIRKELQATDPEVEKQAILALAEVADTSVVPSLKGLLTDLTPWDLRIAAAEALLILNNHDGVGVLKQGLQSHDPFTRIAAVEVFKKYQIQGSLEILKVSAKDEYINVAIGAIEALVEYQKKDCKDLFAEMMEAPSPLVKIAAATAYLRSE